MRRTKAAQIYRKTGNLRAVQLLLGHTKLESTVRYLGIEVDDALNMAEQIEIYLIVDHRHPRDCRGSGLSVVGALSERLSQRTNG